jgi:hypothetical protein
MKKVLLIAAVAAGLYYLTSGKKKTTTSNLPSNSTAQPTFLEQYEGKLVIDSKGYWMVIKNGKIFTFSNVDGWAKYAQENPQHSTPVKVNFPAWEQYATQQVGGVTTLPGY